MQNAPLVPANFRITRRAQSKLNELTSASSKSSGHAMVPALFSEYNGSQAVVVRKKEHHHMPICAPGIGA